MKKLAGIYGLSFPQNMVQLLNAENQFPLMFWSRLTKGYASTLWEDFRTKFFVCFEEGHQCFQNEKRCYSSSNQTARTKTLLGLLRWPLQTDPWDYVWYLDMLQLKLKGQKFAAFQFTWFCGCLFSIWNLHALPKNLAALPLRIHPSHPGTPKRQPHQCSSASSAQTLLLIPVSQSSAPWGAAQH